MYKHRIVQGLSDLLSQYGGKSDDIMIRSLWFGIRSQVPSLLQTLDDNEEAIAEIEKKMKEILDIKPEPLQLEPEPDTTREDLIALYRRRNKDGTITIRVPADSKLSALFPFQPITNAPDFNLSDVVSPSAEAEE